MGICEGIKGLYDRILKFKPEGVSKTKFLSSLPVSIQTIQSWQFRQPINLKNVEKIADHLNVDFFWLLFGVDTKEKPKGSKS